MSFTVSLAHTIKMYFGAIMFTSCFRLERFAVYASSPLLPPEMQDELYVEVWLFLSTEELTPSRSEQLCPTHRPFH